MNDSTAFHIICVIIEGSRIRYLYGYNRGHVSCVSAAIELGSEDNYDAG